MRLVMVLLVIVIGIALIGVPAANSYGQEEAPTYVGGSALDLVPPGAPGVVSVIQVGPYGEVGIPLVVWNDTELPVVNIQVLATVRGSEGQLLAAMTQSVNPPVILPGTFGFTRIPFWTQLPGAPAASDVIEFDYFVPNPPQSPGESMPRSLPLSVQSAELSGSAIIGRTLNTTDVVIKGVSTQALCFDSAGRAGEFYGAYETTFAPVEPGGEFPFALEVELPCDRFLVTTSAIVI